MKNGISFLAIIATVFCANCANASECVGDDCDFKPIISEQDNIDILQPIEYDIDWLNEPEQQSCSYVQTCPFKTDAECDAWFKKPTYRTTMLPRAPYISNKSMDDVLYAIYANYEIDANDLQMSPLLERYKMLMRASRACCGAGIIYKMQQNGADDNAIYNFMKDDANRFAVMSRCMVMNDDEILPGYSNGVTGQMIADVRNACLCKNRQWIEDLLQPFFDVYDRAPQFIDSHFPYTYIDDMQREITVFINDEIHTTSGLLGACPK